METFNYYQFIEKFHLLLLLKKTFYAKWLGSTRPRGCGCGYGGDCNAPQ
jgi:hypothetical protein